MLCFIEIGIAFALSAAFWGGANCIFVGHQDSRRSRIVPVILCGGTNEPCPGSSCRFQVVYQYLEALRYHVWFFLWEVIFHPLQLGYQELVHSRWEFVIVVGLLWCHGEDVTQERLVEAKCRFLGA